VAGSDSPKEAQKFKAGLFGTSLHHTGEGMRHAYDAAGGFGEVTGIPYDKVKCQEDNFACTPCHINSCDRCHVKGEGENAAYSLAAARRPELCFGCHGREAAAAKMDEAAKTPDVHSGMKCTECHGTKDVHGDGQAYESLNSPGAMHASCAFCHGGGGTKTGSYDPEIRAHKVHSTKLDCSACHVTASMTCYNCHFEAAMKTGEKKGNFVPMKSWLLLVNQGGKVTAGGVQTLVWKDKGFIAFAPQFTHSVTAKGRQCPDCHANEAVRLMNSGQKVPVVAYKDGKVVPWKGVIPALPEKLDWVFLDKKDGQWRPVKVCVKEQWLGQATPLREDQLKRLNFKIGQ
jgi:hypothetical protein